MLYNDHLPCITILTIALMSFDVAAFICSFTVVHRTCKREDDAIKSISKNFTVRSTTTTTFIAWFVAPWLCVWTQDTQSELLMNLISYTWVFYGDRGLKWILTAKNGSELNAKWYMVGFVCVLSLRFFFFLAFVCMHTDPL